MTNDISRILIATPSIDRKLSVEYVLSLLETSALLTQYGIAVDLSVIGGDCFVAKARNHCIMQFLDMPDADTLFFIDADQGWNAEAFVRMALDPHEVVAAAVPKKTDAQIFNNLSLVTDDAKNCVIDGGLLKTDYIGTGMFRLKRAVIEKMIAAYPQTYLPGDGGPYGYHHQLFEAGIKDGKFWGEDLDFCNKWTAIGGDIWVDPDVLVKHVGHKVWEANFLTFLKQNCDVRTIEQPIEGQLLTH